MRLFAALLFIFPPACLAGPIAIVSYSIPNGQTYRDDTYSGAGNRGLDGDPLSGGLGQLTDGIVGVTDWAADLGSGPSYEWVGWATIRPAEITLHFEAEARLDLLRIHSNNAGTGGVLLWSPVWVAFSQNGETFPAGTPGQFGYWPGWDERGDPTARFIDVSLGGERASALRLWLYPGPYAQWVMISEVQVLGEPVQTTATPEPGTALLSLCALLLPAYVAYTRYRVTAS